MQMLELIRRKRGGNALPKEDIDWLVRGVVDGSIPDYQIAALLMAINYEGLSDAETAELTSALADSGERLDWSCLPGPVVDKHSTGGVGDKVSIALIPWMASAGVYMPKLSGRGLGHTGGTIDKLESIPGFRSDLSHDEQRELVQRIGCMDCAQTANLVPADKKLYALRDATDTVRDDGLVASSVMSKKLASGADYIVIDVKCGNGAFFPDEARAYHFARLVLSIGRAAGRSTACVISDMNQPLGHAIGNALEVREAFNLLQHGEGPRDLRELCQTLGASLLVQCGICQRLAQGIERMNELLLSGAAWAKATEWIAAQGGSLSQFDKKLGELLNLRHVELNAAEAGFISGFDTLALGELARSLGAGRLSLEDVIDPLVGIVLQRKIGDEYAKGDVLAEVYAGPEDERSDDELLETLQAAIRHSDFDVQPPILIKDVLFKP